MTLDSKIISIMKYLNIYIYIYCNKKFKLEMKKEIFLDIKMFHRVEFFLKSVFFLSTCSMKPGILWKNNLFQEINYHANLWSPNIMYK